VKAGEQLAGSRSCGRRHRAAAGSSAALDAGRQPDGARDNADPTGIGQTLNWAWAWPANRRLYNRASCDVRQAVRPEAQADRLERQAWGGADVPDFKADEPPEAGWARSS
jgi:formate dehydrogenase major subunit